MVVILLDLLKTEDLKEIEIKLHAQKTNLSIYLSIHLINYLYIPEINVKASESSLHNWGQKLKWDLKASRVQQ